VGKGAYLTDYFNYAAASMMQNDELRAFIPVCTVALGNVLVYENQADIKQVGIPIAYDSIWLRGIFGHQYYRYM
jgi:hypothetical protein